MHVDEVRDRLLELRLMQEQINSLNIPLSVVPMVERQRTEREINRIAQTYLRAVDCDIKYLRYVRKPLNRAKEDLQRWVYYYELDQKKKMGKLAAILFRIGKR